MPSAEVRDTLSSTASDALVSTKVREDDMQLSLISADSPVTEKLKSIDLNTLTPIEAMNLLYELKNMI